MTLAGGECVYNFQQLSEVGELCGGCEKGINFSQLRKAPWRRESFALSRFTQHLKDD